MSVHAESFESPDRADTGAPADRRPSFHIERALLDVPIMTPGGGVIFPMVEIYLHDDGAMKAGRVSAYKAPHDAAPADDVEATLRRNLIHEVRIGRYADAMEHLADLVAMRLGRHETGRETPLAANGG